jgi:hypothetical protein
MVKIPSIDVDSGEEWRESSLPPDYSHHIPNNNKDPDTCSLRSHISENSFKTASSEPQLNLVPRQEGISSLRSFLKRIMKLKLLLLCGVK